MKSYRMRLILLGYRILVRVFPARFRREYESELLDSGRLWLQSEAQSGNRIVPAGLRLLLDTLIAALATRREYRRRSRYSPITGGETHMLHFIWRDFQFGIRMMIRTPAVTLVAIASLAFGMGINTAVFSVFDAVLLQTLPVQQPVELVLLRPRRGEEAGTLSYPLFKDFSRQQRVFAGVLAATGAGLSRAVVDGEFLDDVKSEAVSGSFFQILGVRPELGLFFGPDDDHPGGGPAGPLAVLSYAFWQRQFGGSSDVLGRSLSLDGMQYAVAGVTPPEFYGTARESSPDVWVPMEVALDRDTLEWRTGSFFEVMARMKPGVDRREAERSSSLLFRQLLQAEVDAGLRTMIREDRPVKIHHFELEPAAGGFAGLRRAYSEPLSVLLALVGLVLLVACLNVAGLLLVRGRARRRELAIRLALGSGRFRLCGQLLIESLLLALVASALGLLVARLSWLLLGRLSLGSLQVDLDLVLNNRVLLFSLLIGLLTSLIFGSFPALAATRIRIISALRSQDGRSFRDGGKTYWGKLLVVVQLAASLLLLVCSTLLLRSLYEMTSVKTGFEEKQVLLMDVTFDLPAGDDVARRNMAARVHETLNQVPGVEAASISWLTLFSTSDMAATLHIEGYQTPADQELAVRLNAVTPDYFRSLGTPRLRGRSLEISDRHEGPLVAVVNDTFTRRFLEGRDPLGRRFRISGEERPIEVVGVYEDFIWNDLRQEPTPMFFVPLAQFPMSPRSVAVRSGGDPLLLVDELKARLRDLDPSVLFRDVKTLREQVTRSVSRERLLGKLTVVLGGLALFLAAVGLYGLMSFSVARRFREIGLRMALGAGRRSVERLILREVLLLVAGGLVMGLLLAFWVVGFLESYLFQLAAYDPLSIGLAMTVLLSTSVLAGWLPARRAARLDPAQVLRSD